MNISAGKMLCKPFLFFLQFRLICLISDESDDDPFDLLKEGQENVCIIFFYCHQKSQNFNMHNYNFMGRGIYFGFYYVVDSSNF